MKCLPTVKDLQVEAVLQIARQSLVTDVSGIVSRPRREHSWLSEQKTVVLGVFSYVHTPPKHCPFTFGVTIVTRITRHGRRWYQMWLVRRCLCNRDMRSDDNSHLAHLRIFHHVLYERVIFRLETTSHLPYTCPQNLQRLDLACMILCGTSS